MKPGDHPEFFRFPAPEGRSRESTIRLDGEGRFWHEGNPVEHAKLAQAMHGWVSRHPDDGRFILTNGYDWTYFTVEDAPYSVRAVRLEAGGAVLVLSDGTEEPWDPARTRIGAGDALYTQVKRGVAPAGVDGKASQEPKSEAEPFEAKFTRFAQAQLAPVLTEDAASGGVAANLGGRVMRIGA